MTFAGVSRHIGVLESAGLVRREVRGREHWLSLQPNGLTMAQEWIDEQTEFWSQRADALAARLRRKRRRTMSEAPIVRVQRVMPAPPSVVFDEWLDPEAMKEWMCPRPVRCVAITVEPRVGGTVRFDVDDSGTSVLIAGQFLAVDRPNALRFTWSNSNWADPTIGQRRQRRLRAVRRGGDAHVHRAFPHAPRGIREFPQRLDPHLRTACNIPAGRALAVQLSPQDTFEGYVIDDVLGRGGSATVYRAHHADVPGPALALKVLDQHHHDEAHLTRLLREFELARRASHPHVVTVYACGSGWLTMQLAAGGTAMALTSRQDRLAALAQIADALDHVHVTGVVHCDVKPSNILVLEDFPSDGVILTDFGIARSMTDDTGRRPKSVEASLPYAAPEVLRGHAPSAASDEYSLACTAVEMLTGAAPFRSATTMALIAAQIESPVPRYARRFDWIPHAFDSIVAKAMAKDPDRRYQSCAEFIDLMTRSLG